MTMNYGLTERGASMKMTEKLADLKVKINKTSKKKFTEEFFNYLKRSKIYSRLEVLEEINKVYANMGKPFIIKGNTLGLVSENNDVVDIKFTMRYLDKKYYRFALYYLKKKVKTYKYIKILKTLEIKKQERAIRANFVHFCDALFCINFLLH